jgi:hypothetical protein
MMVGGCTERMMTNDQLEDYCDYILNNLRDSLLQVVETSNKLTDCVIRMEKRITELEEKELKRQASSHY